FVVGLGATEVSASVVCATAKAVLGGGASIQVIGWTNGVLTAMVMNKIKFATAAVLTTGMLGTGVGWVVVPGNGPGIIGGAQAEQGPAADQARREQEEAKRQRDLAEQARAIANRAEAELKNARADVDR